MATASSLTEIVKKNFLQLSGGTMTGNLTVSRGYDALSLRIPSGSKYTDLSFKNSSGTRRAFTRVTESDTAIDYCTQLYVPEASNAYPINFTISYSKDTGNVYAKINSDAILTSSNTTRIIQSWRSGYNWYRVYSDGFIEQGGTFGANNGGWTDATFSFPKAFSNTNYNLFVQGNWSDPSASSCWVHARSASSVTVRHANNYYSTMPSYFVAYGT